MRALLVLLAFGAEPPPPPLEVANLLPTAAAAQKQIDYAEAVRKGYSEGWPGHGIIYWNCWYWHKVLEVHDTSRTVRQRRESIGELVRWLGWEAVLTGRLPPAVPLELIPTR